MPDFILKIPKATYPPKSFIKGAGFDEYQRCIIPDDFKLSDFISKAFGVSKTQARKDILSGAVDLEYKQVKDDVVLLNGLYNVRYGKTRFSDYWLFNKRIGFWNYVVCLLLPVFNVINNITEKLFKKRWL